jgi:hypothetical protein
MLSPLHRRADHRVDGGNALYGPQMIHGRGRETAVDVSLTGEECRSTPSGELRSRGAAADFPDERNFRQRDGGALRLKFRHVPRGSHAPWTLYSG